MPNPSQQLPNANATTRANARPSFKPASSTTDLGDGRSERPTSRIAAATAPPAAPTSMAAPPAPSSPNSPGESAAPQATATTTAVTSSAKAVNSQPRRAGRQPFPPTTMQAISTATAPTI